MTLVDSNVHETFSISKYLESANVNKNSPEYQNSTFSCLPPKAQPGILSMFLRCFHGSCFMVKEGRRCEQL